MDQALLDRILRSPNLPTLPAVAVRILDLTQDVNVSIQELARTIENDQALSARVLRTVNSSFYGLRRSCTTIDQALVMLGLSTVKTLALSFSLVTALRKGGDEEFDHAAYWRRSLHSAIAARLIARETQLANPDEAFLGALLQDIGVMAMYQTIGPGYLRIVRAAQEHRELAGIELAELETQHAEVGAMLAQRWRLPVELIIPIKYHEQPAAAPEQYGPLVRAVGLANIASDVLSARNPGTVLRRFRTMADRWFSLPPLRCDDILGEITQAAQEASSLFLLNIGGDIDADAILARAREQLAALDDDADACDSDRAAISQLVSDSQEFDPLTGSLTRRAMLSLALEIFDRSECTNSAVSVIALAIDDYPKLLQQVDQTDADVLLVETAAVLNHLFQPIGASIARWERGIFMMLVPKHDEEAAIAAIDKARQTLMKNAIAWFPASKCNLLSWSAGVASLPDVGPVDAKRGVTLFTNAIQSLEKARLAGGNCTLISPQRMAA